MEIQPMKQNYTINVSNEQIGQKMPKKGDFVKVVTQDDVVARSSEIGQKLPLDSIAKKATFYSTQIRRFSLQSHAAYLLPNERVANCLRLRTFFPIRSAVDTETPIYTFIATI